MSHDGLTYYFQTMGQTGDGRLYAINTADGSVKWSYATASQGWEIQASAPIVTPNRVLVVGNNAGGTYFALRDDGTNATLLATLAVASGGDARNSATLSPDGLLYLPARLTWTQSNGDADPPSQAVANLYNAFDLSPVIPAQWSQRHADAESTGRAKFTVPAVRQGTNFFDVLRWQKRAPGSSGEGNLGSSAMVFYDGVGPAGTDLVVGGYHWPKGVQGMDRHTGKFFWNGNPDGGESIGDNTAAFSPGGATLYVINDATAHPLMAFASAVGPATYWHNGANADPGQLGAFSPKVAPDGRIFAHGWNDRPYAGKDSGTAIAQTWAAASPLCECVSLPAIWTSATRTNVIATGRCGTVSAFDGTTGAELWSVAYGRACDADPTVDPATGSIYLPIGVSSIQVVGLSSNGVALWASVAMPVFDWQDGVNNPQRAMSAGCLAHDGLTPICPSASFRARRTAW